MSFVELIQTIGFPAAGLVFIAYGLWKGGKWIGTTLLKPIADRHIAFVDKVEAVVENQAQAILTSNVNILKISEAIVVMTKTNNDTLQRVEAVTSQLQTIASTITEVKNVVLKTENVTLIPNRGSKKNDPSSG